jgi:adenylosuccinate synthase
MPQRRHIILLGAQYSDEGKGKLASHLARDATTVVRFNGGAGAGHRVVQGEHSVDLHMLPAGVLTPGRENVLGRGVMVDLEALEAELPLLAPGAHVVVDTEAYVTLPLHRMLGACRDGDRHEGSTGKGIGPVHEDAAGRRGLQFGDLAAGPDAIRQRLLGRGYYKERAAALAAWGVVPPSLDALVDWAQRFAPLAQGLAADTGALLRQRVRQGARLLFEGAHGVLIDRFVGTAPFTTSSLTTAASVAASTGLYLDPADTLVLGAMRPWPTRLGAGPFPTEFTDPALRRALGEAVESTTGRPQRLGWLDLPALRRAVADGGIQALAITKVDLVRLPVLPVCVAYEGPLPEASMTARALAACRPVLLDMPGWQPEALRQSRSLADLPQGLCALLALIAEHTGVPVVAIGTGPGIDDVLWDSSAW